MKRKIQADKSKHTMIFTSECMPTYTQLYWWGI